MRTTRPYFDPWGSQPCLYHSFKLALVDTTAKPCLPRARDCFSSVLPMKNTPPGPKHLDSKNQLRHGCKDAECGFPRNWAFWAVRSTHPKYRCLSPIGILPEKSSSPAAASSSAEKRPIAIHDGGFAVSLGSIELNSLPKHGAKNHNEKTLNTMYPRPRSRHYDQNPRVLAQWPKRKQQLLHFFLPVQSLKASDGGCLVSLKKHSISTATTHQT